MPDWFKQLTSGLLSGGTPHAQLAAFGKHPGWDDHLDDLGLNTEALLAVKQYLYVQGIGGVVDAGTWENGAGGAMLAGFKHVFVWTGGADVLIGRMWSSSDGKNRTRYPMVLCAHFHAVNFDLVIHKTLEILERIEGECRATTSAADVGRIMQAGQEEVVKLLGHLDPVPPLMPGFPQRFSDVSGPETLPRLAYAMDTYLNSYAPGKVNRKEMALNLRLHQSRMLPQHLRVPAEPGDVLGTLRFWHGLLAGLTDECAPLLIMAPLGERWVDLIAGPLTPQQLACIRMTPASAPLSCDVPYELDGKAAARAADLFTRKGLDAGAAPVVGNAP